MIRSVNGNFAKQMNLDVNAGVYVDSLLENSAAAAAGIKPGDVITEVNGAKVRTSPELQEQIARKRPGDEVSIVVDRSGKERAFLVTLNNTQGGKNFAAAESLELESLLGAELMTLDDQRKNELNIDGGVVVKELHAGKLARETNMQEGFIITHVNSQKVGDVKELEKVISKKDGGVMIEGIYPDREGKHYFAFGIGS